MSTKKYYLRDIFRTTERRLTLLHNVVVPNTRKINYCGYISVVIFPRSSIIMLLN